MHGQGGEIVVHSPGEISNPHHLSSQDSYWKTTRSEWMDLSIVRLMVGKHRFSYGPRDVKRIVSIS